MKNEGLTTRNLKCKKPKGQNWDDQNFSIEYYGAKSEIIYLSC